MLKAEVIAKLKSWGLDTDKLIAAAKEENEVDYALPEIEVFKKEDLEARDANKVNEGKKLGEKEGETKGKELAAKALKKAFSIEDDTKELDKIVTLVTDKASKGDPVLKEQVTNLIRDKETLTAKVGDLEKAAKSAAFDTQLISWFPAGRTADLKDSERLILAKMDLSFEEVDGKTVVKRNGDVVRDKATQNPLAADKVLADYFTERKWVGSTGTAGGRGGNDTTVTGGAGGIKTLSAAQEAWLKDNPGGNTVSPEFSKYLDTVTKDVPDFDFYN
jgi:hypothetical protein